jgi:hypothetical protein
LRFGFVLTAITLAENRIGLFRSWGLSHGNFWRMFAIGLAVLLPFLILEIIVMYWAGLFPHLPPPGASAAQPQALQAAQAIRQAETMKQVYGLWYVSYPILAVVCALLYGLAAGVQIFAYRALTGTPDSTPSLP